MRLNQASDFALRIMMLLSRETEPVTVDYLAERLKLVKSHVMKIVAKLVKAKLLISQRGRSGGVRLARAPSEVTVGEIVRVIEADFAIVECMLDRESDCVFARACKLKNTMGRARAAFLAVLDGETLQTISEGTSLEPA